MRGSPALATAGEILPLSYLTPEQEKTDESEALECAWSVRGGNGAGGLRRQRGRAGGAGRDGYLHSLAVKSDGTVWASGNNHVGQLGDKTKIEKTVPVQVWGLTDVVAVETGSQHSLALKSAGMLWAWGENSYGQLGTGSTSTGSLVPYKVLTDVVSVSGDMFHTLAVKSDGTVWSWGNNSHGQLGYLAQSNNSTPKQVPNLTGVVQVWADWEHSVALKSDGTVWAWGGNYDGQLGDETFMSRHTPMPVNGLSGVVALASNLALKSDGTLWKWHSTQRVKMLDRVVALSASFGFRMAVKSDGTLWTWGHNSHGQLGDGTTTNRDKPVWVMASVKQ